MDRSPWREPSFAPEFVAQILSQTDCAQEQKQAAAQDTYAKRGGAAKQGSLFDQNV